MASAGSKTIFMITTCIFLFLLLLIPSCTANKGCSKACLKDSFSNGKSYKSCTDLPVLGARLHWTYCSKDQTIDVAFRAKQPNPKGWVSWGLNFDGQGMAGTQALVAYGTTDDGSSVKAYTTPLDGHNPSMQEGNLSFGVAELSAEYCNGEMTIYAKLGPFDGTTDFNHIWQVGDSVSGSTPAVHPMNDDNKNAVGTINFCSGG